MVTNSQLAQMRSTDIRTVNRAALPDVSGFRFDYNLSQEDRAARIFDLIPNPYCFRYEDTVVKLEFADNGPSLQDVMSGFLVRQKSGL